MKRFSRWSLLVGWVLVILVAVLEYRVYYMAIRAGWNGRDQVYVITPSGKRTIRAYYQRPEDNEGLKAALSIELDNDWVYIESDEDGDDRPETIIHFDDGGIQSYVTQYDSKANIKRREVYYYDKGKRRFMLYDPEAEGQFSHRLRFLSETETAREVYRDGAWQQERLYVEGEGVQRTEEEANQEKRNGRRLIKDNE